MLLPPLKLAAVLHQHHFQNFIASKTKINQIEAADKQLKATRKFLEEQAAEREHERDEFTKEIERLKVVIQNRDKERGLHERTEKEVRTFLILIFILNHHENHPHAKTCTKHTKVFHLFKCTNKNTFSRNIWIGILLI